MCMTFFAHVHPHDVVFVRARLRVLFVYILRSMVCGLSLKLSWTFPESDCDSVKEQMVAAAKSMSGFDNCNGGNK